MKKPQINSDDEYKAALAALFLLLDKDDTDLSSSEREKLISLMDEVENYEKENFPLD